MASPGGGISHSVDSMSVGLYSGASNLSTSGNLMISPLSIMYASILVYLGSKGHTKGNLFSSLSLGKSFSNADADIASAFGEALKQLKPSSFGAKTGFRSKSVYELALANGVFVKNGLKLDTNYLAAVTLHINASIKNADFLQTSEAARADINEWVEEQTNGRIKDLVPQGAISINTVSVLANAIYFKATWLDQFDPYHTKNGSFTLLNGSRSTVPLMTKHVAESNYYEDSSAGLEYLEVPYAGSQTSLLLYLPREKNGLRSVEKVLSERSFHYDSLATERIVDLTLPKFRVESSFDLKRLLEKVGVHDIFEEGADLSGMVPEGGAKISSAFHKTFIEVDEKGTEAAAASAAIAMSRSGPNFKSRLPRINFVVDHPFYFAIRHNPTKLILFAGRVENV